MKPTTGTRARPACSRTRQIVSAWASPSDPPRYEGSWAKQATGRPSTRPIVPMTPSPSRRISPTFATRRRWRTRAAASRDRRAPRGARAAGASHRPVIQRERRPRQGTSSARALVARGDTPPAPVLRIVRLCSCTPDPDQHVEGRRGRARKAAGRELASTRRGRRRRTSARRPRERDHRLAPAHRADECAGELLARVDERRRGRARDDGDAGLANSTSASASRKGVTAGCICGEWNAPATSSSVVRRPRCRRRRGPPAARRARPTGRPGRARCRWRR